MAGTADESAEALERIREALRGLRFGAVTAIVHDGAVVQVERPEKLRLQKGEPGRILGRSGSRPAGATSDSASERPT
jgi:hypothetical protein